MIFFFFLLIPKNNKKFLFNPNFEKFLKELVVLCLKNKQNFFNYLKTANLSSYEEIFFKYFCKFLFIFKSARLK